MLLLLFCTWCELDCTIQQLNNNMVDDYNILQPFNLYLVCIAYTYITSNINTFGKRNTLEGRWSGKCRNFNWMIDALASWNCRLLLYNLVDVHDIETGLSTQFWYISAKNKLIQIYNLMLLVSEKNITIYNNNIYYIYI
jgi:hypothetical protein